MTLSAPAVQLNFPTRPEYIQVRSVIDHTLEDCIDGAVSVLRSIRDTARGPVFFHIGSARFEKGNANYTRAFNTTLQVVNGIEGAGIITGNGPGVMRAGNEAAASIKAPSFGVGLRGLKKEEPNPFSTHGAATLKHFGGRKKILIEGSNGLLGSPGGFGTLDELYETLRLLQISKLPKNSYPVILDNRDFWESLISIHKKLSPNEDLRKLGVKIVDSGEQVVGYLKQNSLPRYKSPKDRFAEDRLINFPLKVEADLHRVYSKISTFLMNANPNNSGITISGRYIPRKFEGIINEAVDIGNQLGEHVITNHFSLVASIVQEASPLYHINLIDKDELTTDGSVSIECDKRLSRRIVSTREARAFIFTTIDIDNLDMLFEVATLMQCDKMQKRPIVLIGDQWHEYLSVVRQVLLNDDFKTIRPEDMDLFTVVVNKDELRSALSK